MGSCTICQRTKYVQRGPIEFVTVLHMPVRPYSYITMNFLKVSMVFIKCSVLYHNIPVGKDHIVCISRLWTIIDRLSRFQFLIPVPDNFTAEQCTATFDTHVVPTMGYSCCIVFDRDTLFILSDF